MQKYKRILAGFDWYLIRNIGVVAVQGLAIRFQRLVRVVSARLRFNRTAYQETALLTNSKDAVVTTCTQGKQGGQYKIIQSFHRIMFLFCSTEYAGHRHRIQRLVYLFHFLFR